jgi:hypothetical protein
MQDAHVFVYPVLYGIVVLVAASGGEVVGVFVIVIVS